MLLVDDRIGSKDLETPLKKLKLPVQLERLSSADVAFVGKGAKDASVLIGVEVKTVYEMISDLTDPRFSGDQLGRMLDTYDESYLIVWGRHRANQYSGVLQLATGTARVPGKPVASPWHNARIGRRDIAYATLWKHLWTLETKTGLHVIHVSGKTELYQHLATLYTWWTEGWETHTSHQRDYTSRPRALDLPRKRTLLEQICALLPGIGPRRALQVAAYFGADTSPVNALLRMSETEPKAWESVPGVGRTGGKKIVSALKGVR